MLYRFVAALAATMAGVAIVHLVLPAPDSGTALPASRIGGRSKSDVATTSMPVRSASLVSAQSRAPVPILLDRHASNVSPKETPRAIDPQDDNIAPVGDSFDERAARVAIETDGYKGVRVLSRRADGAWIARALRGQTEVTVRVDSGGNVSAN